jgi:hypothetical protein
MRVVIQTKIWGSLDTIWSAEMLTRSNEVRERKVMEAQALAAFLALSGQGTTFQVGVLDKGARETGLTLVTGRNLLEQVRRAIVHATRGCLTKK